MPKPEQFPGAMPEPNTEKEKMNETFDTLAALIEQTGDEDELVRTKKAQSALMLKKLRDGTFNDFRRSGRYAMFLENDGFVDGFIDALTAGGFDVTSAEEGKLHDWKPLDRK